MKNKSFNKKANYLRNNFSQYFSEYKLILFLAGLFLLVGIGTGIFTAVRYSGNLSLDNLSDSNLIEFLKGDKGTTGLIFPYLFSFCLFFGIIAFLNFKPFLIGLNFFALLVKGYLIGFDLTILIILYGFAGIINVFIVILPFDLFVCIVLLVLTSFAVKRNLCIKKYGASNTCKNIKINYTKTYWFLFVIGVLFVLLKCLFLPLIRVTIIVA